MNCTVEEIPMPKVNRVLGLTNAPKNIINKNYIDILEDGNETIDILIYENDDGEEIKYPYKHIKQTGGVVNLTVTGDMGASYDLVVKDITNTKWYNWQTLEFENGYNSKQGVIDYIATPLIIPPALSEVEYNIFFNSIGSTEYNIDLPTETKPWYICQLMNATTVFAFDDSNSSFVPETKVSKIYPPNTIINTRGRDIKTDLTVTVRPKRGKIKLINEDVLRVRVDPNEFVPSWKDSPDRLSVIESDLYASVDTDYSIGTITGTITLERSPLRDLSFNVNPSSFFKII
jgi:hypothetical protein